MPPNHIEPGSVNRVRVSRPAEDRNLVLRTRFFPGSGLSPRGRQEPGSTNQVLPGFGSLAPRKTGTWFYEPGSSRVRVSRPAEDRNLVLRTRFFPGSGLSPRGRQEPGSTNQVLPGFESLAPRKTGTWFYEPGSSRVRVCLREEDRNLVLRTRFFPEDRRHDGRQGRRQVEGSGRQADRRLRPRGGGQG